MRNVMVAALVTLVLVVSATAVFAGPPIAGTYKSTDGDFDEGTATTSIHSGSYLFMANVIYGQSSAGGVFTNDWTLGCAMAVSVSLIVPKFGPTGQEIWQITYAPGSPVTLGGPGNPWDGGDAVYNGVIDNYTEIRTVQYVNNIVQGAVSDHAISAHLTGYNDSCVAWAIGNGVLRGHKFGIGFPFAGPPTLQIVKGPGYPDYPSFPPGCSLNAVGSGHWDDLRDLTLSITGCAVATEKSTWGGVKSMYRN